MPILSLGTSYIDQFLSGKAFSPTIPLPEAHKSLQYKTCKGADYLGWIDLPLEITDESIAEIQAYALSIRQNSDVFIVCGIGGSYLGARALIEALSDNTWCEVVFLGNHLSGREYEKVFTKYQDKRVSACIISKSGTTMETAISYRLVRDFLLTKYPSEEVKKRITTITDEKNGTLRAETERQGYKSYVLPGNIGGRYSVLTPVGLLPCAVAGIDIQKLIEGSRKAREEILLGMDSTSRPSSSDLAGMTGTTHPAFIYAQKRVDLEQSGFVSELFITSEPSLYFIGEWWKQLM